MESEALVTTRSHPSSGMHASKWAPESTSRPETLVKEGSVVSWTELQRTSPGCAASARTDLNEANITDVVEDISQTPIAPLSTSSKVSTSPPNIPSVSAIDPRAICAPLAEHPSQNHRKHFLESIYKLRYGKKESTTTWNKTPQHNHEPA